MILLDNQTNITINLESLENIVNFLNVSNKDIELLIVDDKTIQELNKNFRAKNKPTDVLSFPLEENKYAPIGSIVISSQTAQKAAEKFGHSLEEEITLLFIHGLLHLLGFDHETDNGEMRAKEQEIIKKFNLPPSLIVRN
jgi:probable rRNA maturation factor